MRSAVFFSLVLFATACSLSAVPVYAQNAGEPFRTLELRLSGTKNVNRNFLHEYWEQGFGGEVSAATPFYLGFLEAGGVFHRYRVARPVVPGFDAVYAFAGWGLGVEPSSRLRLEASTRVGNYRMSFDEQTFEGVRNESELGIMFNGRVSVRPAGPVYLHVSGSYLQVYTFQRLKLWYVSAGIGYRLKTPAWLKHFLR